MQIFALPDLGEGLTEAEVVRWLVDEGAVIAGNAPLVEVETAKATVEIPSPYAGTVRTRHAQVGQVVQVGAPLVSIDDAGAPSVNIESNESGNVLVGYGTSAGRGRRPRAALPAPEVPSSGLPRATPPVRRYAKERGVDLRSVAGGADGRIRRADVDAALVRPTTSERNRRPLKGIRRAIAEKMTTSHREIPVATAWVDADATRFCALRNELRQLYPERPPTYLAMLLRLCVAGLRVYPVLNSRLEHDEIVLLDQVNIGFAAATPRGLLVPVVHDAQRRSLLDLTDEVARLTTGAREGTLGAAELSGGTFTVSSYGGFGVDAAAPVVNHPEAAILGAGRIVDRAWVVDGEVAVRKVMTLVISFDHRICDGEEAGGFLRTVADLVENPERWAAVL